MNRLYSLLEPILSQSSVISSLSPSYPSVLSLSRSSLPRSKKRTLLRRFKSIFHTSQVYQEGIQFNTDQDKEPYHSEIQLNTVNNKDIVMYLHDFVNFIYNSSTSLYLFFIIKVLFLSSIFWDTLLLFKLSSPKLKRKLQRKLKGKRTIPSWVLTPHPHSWIILSDIMIHNYLPTPTSFILQQLQSTHDRIKLLQNCVILYPLVLFDFSITKISKAMH